MSFVLLLSLALQGVTPRIGSTFLRILVSPSDSLKPLWVLGVLGDQLLSRVSPEEQWDLLLALLLICRIDPRTPPLGSQSPGDTLWREGADVPCSWG